jgi:hypothetical protein
MEHSTFWPAVRRWAWVPILTACAATAVAVVVAVRTPQYQATASVFTRQQTSNNGPALDFSDIATSNTVLTRALHDVAANESADQLQSRLSVVVSRSSMYRITVADANAQHATSLANAVAAEAARLYEDLGTGNANSVVDELDRDRTHYRDLYLAASQALFNFQTQHPETAALLALTPGSAASAGDATAKSSAAAGYREQFLAASQALATFQNAHPELAKGAATPAVQAEAKQLQLDQQAASQAYVSLQTSAAQDRVAQANSSPPVNVAPAIEAQWQQLHLDVDAASQAYLSLQTATSQARVAQFTAASAFTAIVVDQAVAQGQGNSRFFKAAYVGLLGLIVGVALATALEYVMAPRRQRSAVPASQPTVAAPQWHAPDPGVAPASRPVAAAPQWHAPDPGNGHSRLARINQAVAESSREVGR